MIQFSNAEFEIVLKFVLKLKRIAKLKTLYVRVVKAQTVHKCSLISVFVDCMKKLLTLDSYEINLYV